MFISEISANRYRLLSIDSRSQAFLAFLPSWATGPQPASPPKEPDTEPLRLEAEPPVPNDPDDSEFYWANISAGERQYLTAPRQSPEPCPWCGGRYKHNPTCDELRLSWEPTLPFGKHRGKPLSQIPRDYLEWLRTADGIATDLREAISIELKASGR